MSTHAVLLFAPDRASKQRKPFATADLETAGFEVVESHDINNALALLFVSRKLEEVVIDVADDSVGVEVANCVKLLRPGLPLLVATDKAQNGDETGQGITSTLEGLFSKRVA